MVCGTMLILHSSAMFYSVNRLLCFLLIFVSFGKLIKPYTSCIQLLISSLFCIGANKVLHVFSVWKMIMIDLFLFGHDSLLSYRITHIYMLWVHKNKGHGALFPCVGCSFWVLHLFVFSATSGCTTNGHPVVLSFERDKTTKVTVWVPNYGCHVCPPWNILKA